MPPARPAPAVPGARPQLLPPNLSAYRKGNTGTEYVTTLESRRPGPHVLVNALTHGNELCGAHALDRLLRAGVVLERGKLTLSFANVEAFQRFNALAPYESRFVDEDFNRLWDDSVLASARSSVELMRARALLPHVRAADYLLDLHSMHLDAPPLLLCGMQEKALRLGRAMGFPRHLVCDSGHQAGPRMMDYGAFADPSKPQTGLLIECGQHWRANSAQVAMQATLRFLECTGVVNAAWAAAQRAQLEGTVPPQPQVVIEVTHVVTIQSRDFRLVEDYVGLEVVPRRDTIIGYDGAREIRTPYDQCVLIMPGRNLAPGLT
ncbi:MAG TPA: succinylglutamate desuccinylase/aspartoacylase family protein, partial [bacterium]|nr:succinylglutamate desuccinylase/aspartoacylase family protein [bacterium]